MRYAAKVDENQKDVVTEFEAHGIMVEDLSRVGKGVPDLMLSYGGATYLCEVIGPAKMKRFPPRGLSPNQEEWHEAWKDEVFCVRSVEDARNVARIIRAHSRGTLADIVNRDRDSIPTGWLDGPE